MPSKKKKYNARFPAGRIKKIMQTDEEVGKVAQAVPVIISRTLELFVESLLKKSMQITLSRNAKTLTPSHMKQCILSESRFDFLKDLVKDLPDASVQEDNENNEIFDENDKHNDVDVETPIPVPSHSKRKHSSAEKRSREEIVPKIDLTGQSQPKKRKANATEVSSTSSSSSSSPYPVPSSPHSLPSATATALSAANYYKDHQQSTSSRTPVIQYGPNLNQQNHNQHQEGVTQASQLAFSVKNLLNREVNNVKSEEPNLRITIASEQLPPPPVSVATSSGSTLSPRLASSDNVPPLVLLRMPPVPNAAQVSAPKYIQNPGDLSIDEDYDN